MQNLFTHEINGWDSWRKIYQSISVFEPLIKHIFEKEKLPFSRIEHCTPGTNAIFKIGDYILKIIAPMEAGTDSSEEFNAEVFANNRVASLGVPVPNIIAFGNIEDKYRFSYIVMEYIEGKEFNKVTKHLTCEEKVETGRKLRILTDIFNKPCKPFNKVDVLYDLNRQKRWEKYPESFKRERLNYINSHNFGEKVFVHGDLNGDNILLTHDKKLYIIDFADAVLAPISYEHALIVCELFQFDKAYLKGYFGNYEIDELVEICFNGILIHDFGGDIVRERIGEINEFTNLEVLRKKLYELLMY